MSSERRINFVQQSAAQLVIAIPGLDSQSRNPDFDEFFVIL